MDNLQHQWKQAREAVQLPSTALEDIIVKAQQRKKSVVYFHYGNIGVLTLSLIIISLFFYFKMPMHNWLSVVGATLMMSGLALRIIIEIASSIKSHRIHLIDDLSKTNEAAISFYTFRKKIHGPVTVIIVALYVIGFYLLSAVFSTHMSSIQLLLIHSSFLIGAAFLVWQIRKGIKKEMNHLLALIDVREQIIENLP